MLTHDHRGFVFDNLGSLKVDHILATEATAGNDVGRQLKGFGDVEATWLSYAAHTAAFGEVAVHRCASDVANLVKGGPLESTADIEEVHVVALFFGHTKHPFGRRNG